MAKPTGPLLSFDASGQIAKTQVYATWRGRSYVRRYVIPANPKTASQLLTRDVFAWLQQVWKLGDVNFAAPWTAAAKGNAYTNRNLFSSMNIPSLRTATDVSTIVMSPGFGGMFPATAITVAPTSTAGQLSVAFTVPQLPAGWTWAPLYAFAIHNEDPHTTHAYATIGNNAANS